MAGGAELQPKQDDIGERFGRCAQSSLIFGQNNQQMNTEVRVAHQAISNRRLPRWQPPYIPVKIRAQLHTPPYDWVHAAYLTIVPRSASFNAIFRS